MLLSPYEALASVIERDVEPVLRRTRSEQRAERDDLARAGQADHQDDGMPGRSAIRRDAIADAHDFIPSKHASGTIRVFLSLLARPGRYLLRKVGCRSRARRIPLSWPRQDGYYSPLAQLIDAVFWGGLLLWGSTHVLGQATNWSMSLASALVAGGQGIFAGAWRLPEAQ